MFLRVVSESTWAKTVRITEKMNIPIRISEQIYAWTQNKEHKGNLFISVWQHVPHGVHQKGELRTLLVLLIPTFPHDLITAEEQNHQHLLRIRSHSFTNLFSKQTCLLLFLRVIYCISSVWAIISMFVSHSFRSVVNAVKRTRRRRRTRVWSCGILSSERCKTTRSWAGLDTGFLLQKHQ